MTATPAPPARRPATRRAGGVRSLYAGNATAVLERAFLATRSTNWAIVVSGFFEPVFYLLAMGFGLGGLVGAVAVNGQEVPYAA